MKGNKKLTLALIIISVIIWSIIFYQIGSSLFIVQRTVINTNTPKKEEQNDRVVLIMDYRDPFLNSQHKNIIIKESNIEVSPPNFIYKGHVKHNHNNMIILKQNETMMLINKDTIIDGYKIRKVYNDSIIVVKKGTSYTICIQ